MLIFINDEALAKNRTKRIINGEEAEPDEFPHQAQIRYKWDRSHLCGATIISYWHILTAAHCFHVGKNEYGFPSNYQVVVGSIYLNGDDGHVHDLLEYYIPVEFDPTTLKHDIAVIKVREISLFLFFYIIS